MRRVPALSSSDFASSTRSPRRATSRLEPHRLVERAAIAPPTSSASTFGSSASMTSIFPEILEPPSTATNGRFGFSSALCR
jgi:hypothetical protein